MRTLISTGLLFAYMLGCGQQFVTTIKGTVKDKDTQHALWGANVLVKYATTTKGTSSTENGTFAFDSIPMGRISLQFSLVGYSDVLLNDVLVSSGKQLNLNIEMQEKVNEINEVEVTAQRDKSKANNDFASTSVRSFSADEMTRYAGTLNDPARMAQSFAGVMTANDENNQIVVRGNSPRGLLWRLEGIEIPNPNHFAGNEGATGGGVSILSANMLTNTDFYSGAFPAEYGNALSSVFDLNFRKGNNERHEFALQVGILGAEAAIEGPFSKKYRGSYLINYRYSTLDLFALTGFKIGGDITPKYQDANFNFYFPTKKAGSFTLFGLGGLSSLGETVPRDTSKWKTFDDKTAFVQKQLVGVVGITHLLPLQNNKSYVKTIVSYSYTNNSSLTDTFSYDYDKYNIETSRFRYQTLRAHIFVNSKLNTKNTIRCGALWSNYRYNLYNREYSFVEKLNFTRVDNTGQTNLAQAYIMWKHRFTDRTILNSGMHGTLAQINNKLYIEPRIGVEHLLNEKMTLSAGAGLHSRIDALSTYVSYTDSLNQSRSNRQLDFSRALHTVLGYNYSFHKNFRLKTELYFQYLFAVPVGANIPQNTFSLLNFDDGFLSYPLQSTGKGINYGIEITLEKFFSQQYFFMFTTSLFDSRYKARENKWRNTAYNVNYVFNLLGGKEFTVGKRKNNIIGINTKIIWRGGQRYTPVDLPASIAAGQTVLNHTESYTKKLSDYYRVDFGLNFRRNKKKYSWVLSFDAQNIINRENPAREIYNPETQKTEIKRTLGIVPVASWKVYFSIK